MCALSEHVSIWPPPIELLRHGNTLTYLRSLKAIAGEVTYTKYPDIFVVPNPLSPAVLESKDMVLKRTYSSGTNFLSQMDGNEALQHVVSKKVAASMEQYDNFKEWINPQWFIMPLIPQWNMEY